MKDTFQDPKYDRLRVWVAVPSTGQNGSSNVVFKVYNQTNTDFILPYKDLELVTKGGDEVQINPSYRQYSLTIPHGKYVTVALPMETKITPNDGPYTLRLRSSNNSDDNKSFTNTKKSFSPAEVKFSNQTRIDKLFVLPPSSYPQDQIKWANQAISGNSITATCVLSDYWGMYNDASSYQLVGSNDTGERKAIIPQQVKPKVVNTTSPTKVMWKFKSLDSIMNYQHVTLQYEGRTVLQLKN